MFNTPRCCRYGYQQQSGGSSASSYSAPAPAPAVDMSRFMDRYGGCFAPQSPVALADGTTTSIECLRPGMRVLGGARVEHVVRINYDAAVPMVALPGAAGDTAPATSTMCRNRAALRLRLQDCNTVRAGCGVTLVTPWHPVRIAGNWTFPSLIVAPCPLYMDCVYNIVLSSDHVICINGLDFITLGHGIISHPVLSHAFFGTQAVVRALRSKQTSSGVVVITNGFCRRASHSPSPTPPPPPPSPNTHAETHSLASSAASLTTCKLPPSSQSLALSCSSTQPRNAFDSPRSNSIHPLHRRL